mmetsp:Transcript_18190/g.45718  ORF Transcript_18190/g.45718 Transcript_18190/m.45718 type:complete len:91 (-) Transcript_18190:216-488(-)
MYGRCRGVAGAPTAGRGLGPITRRGTADAEPAAAETAVGQQEAPIAEAAVDEQEQRSEPVKVDTGGGAAPEGGDMASFLRGMTAGAGSGA